MPEQTKSAFVAIVGRPNVGKSSLLNAMVGRKVAIVSDKPQTTRTRIMGVLTRKETQLVFLDTPGNHRPRTRLGDFMVKSIGEAVSGVDAGMLVVEPKGEIRDVERELLEQFRRQKLPAVLVINKIDTLADKAILLNCIERWAGGLRFHRRPARVRPDRGGCGRGGGAAVHLCLRQPPLLPRRRGVRSARTGHRLRAGAGKDAAAPAAGNPSRYRRGH